MILKIPSKEERNRSLPWESCEQSNVFLNVRNTFIGLHVTSLRLIDISPQSSYHPNGKQTLSQFLLTSHPVLATQCKIALMFELRMIYLINEMKIQNQVPINQLHYEQQIIHGKIIFNYFVPKID